METSYSETDLSTVPYFTHAVVENYAKYISASSGESNIHKGFQYFSEGYITDITGK